MKRTLLHMLAAFGLTGLISGCTTGPVDTSTLVSTDFAYSGDFDRPPVVKSMPRTQYPQLLREKGVGGTATVTFTVNARGRVEQSRVESASEPSFGGAAIGTVGPMEFHPATKNGKPVPALGTATFTFGVGP